MELLPGRFDLLFKSDSESNFGIVVISFTLVIPDDDNFSDFFNKCMVFATILESRTSSFDTEQPTPDLRGVVDKIFFSFEGLPSTLFGNWRSGGILLSEERNRSGKMIFVNDAVVTEVPNVNGFNSKRFETRR